MRLLEKIGIRIMSDDEWLAQARACKHHNFCTWGDACTRCGITKEEAEKSLVA